MRRLLPVLLFATLALASCGGGDDKENVQDLLDKAFSSSIKSADLKLDASIQLKGSPGLDKPVRISASGPFRTTLVYDLGDNPGGTAVRSTSRSAPTAVVRRLPQGSSPRATAPS